MQLSRNPPDDFGLTKRGLVGAEFVTMGPKILGRFRIRDLDIDAQHFGTASLNAPGHKIFGFRLGAPVGTAMPPGPADDRCSENPRPCSTSSR